MATPAGTTATDVVAGETCVSGGNPVSFKPATSGIKDSTGNAATFGWTVPLSCAAATQNKPTGQNEYLTYDLYWNSQFTDGQDNMYQLGQVKFSCRIDPYQEDAGIVTIYEDSAHNDPAEQYIDISNSIDLSVNRVSSNEFYKNNKIIRPFSMEDHHKMRQPSLLVPLSPLILMQVHMVKLSHMPQRPQQNLVTTWS